MKSVVSLGTAAMLIAALACFGTVQAQDKAEKPAGPSYVGINSCKMCHNSAAQGAMFDTWAKTAHSKAFANLPAEGKKNTTCFGCHTTGFGKAGGYDPASPKAAQLEGVTCEACHGPGSEYKSATVMKDPAKAKAAGLIMPDAATCTGCHEGKVPEGHKALPKFDFATSAKVIEHHIPKK